MSHRGRLNVLANILGKPLPAIFSEFEDNQPGSISGEGDVKYHKGYSADVAGLHLSLAFNPSHLEAVDPVVEGKCRAHQDDMGVDGGKRLLPLLVHGDAAFAGQGMVAETLNLSQLEGYSPAARFISSSTTRSASPPCRKMPGQPATPQMSPRC